MGYYIAVEFSFSCNSIKRLTEVAVGMLNIKTMSNLNDSYTKQMLLEIVKNGDKYMHYGNKGAMFAWGGVWNYYTVDDELPLLEEFLRRCWQYRHDEENILFGFERALLIVNREQEEQSEMYEISFDDEKIITRKIEIDFCWNQY
jgi:hypothetical protein